jgi:hypothetical protein
MAICKRMYEKAGENSFIVSHNIMKFKLHNIKKLNMYAE